MWSVRVLTGQQAGQIFDLKIGKNTIGRGGSADLKISSLGISKEHCEIHVYKDKMMVIDLKSSNGTFVNGVKAQSSLLHVGDKLSLFDIILDVIPTPDIRPKKKRKKRSSSHKSKSDESVSVNQNQSLVSLGTNQQPTADQLPVYPASSDVAGQVPANSGYFQSGNLAMQMPQHHLTHGMPRPMATGPQAVTAEQLRPQLSFQQKAENYIENVAMPAVYRLAILFPFKNVLLGFVLAFIFMVTLLSVIPLNTITKEANFSEASKRAKSVARAMAKVNEQALISGQFGQLATNEAMKEEGIKEAFIIQQSDGVIIAPSEKVGRDVSKPFVLQARRETRATVGMVDSNTIGASYPVGVYDPTTGEPSVKYHAIVFYDISSLNIDEGRLISLFMQTLIIASLFGFAIYFIFIRLVQHPVKKLNEQIETALLDKTDHVEVMFDDNFFQKLVTNVNTLLSKATNNSIQQTKPKPNRDLEYSHLVDMISHPAFVINSEMNLVACNANFEQLCQSSKELLLNQPYNAITDSALVQNIEDLVARSRQNPFEKQSDRIPFAQFECEIHCQVFLNDQGEPEHYAFTLNKVSEDPSLE